MTLKVLGEPVRWVLATRASPLLDCRFNMHPLTMSAKFLHPFAFTMSKHVCYNRKSSQIRSTCFNNFLSAKNVSAEGIHYQFKWSLSSSWKHSSSHCWKKLKNFWINSNETFWIIPVSARTWCRVTFFFHSCEKVYWAPRWRRRTSKWFENSENLVATTWSGCRNLWRRYWQISETLWQMLEHKWWVCWKMVKSGSFKM